MLIMSENMTCTIDTSLFIEKVFGASRVHTFAWSPWWKRTSIAQKDSQNVIEFHIRRFEFTTRKDNSEFKEYLICTFNSMNSTFVMRYGRLSLFSFQNWIRICIHSGYLSFIFCLILAIAALGSLKFDNEIIDPYGVKNFRWKWRKASFDSMFPRPLLGIPMPDSPKAAHLISYAIESLVPSV